MCVYPTPQNIRLLGRVYQFSLLICYPYSFKIMEIYCVSWKEYIASENSNARKTKGNRLIPLSNCAFCSKKN